MKRRDFLRTGVAAGTVGLFDPATGTAQQLTLHDFIMFRLCRGVPRLRRDAHGLVAQNPNHPTLVAYANAVAHMKTLPISDPTSWAYQAAIHGSNLPSGSWPAGAPFSSCNHGASFLAWHRMYLYFFEKIIAKHSGVGNFGLPYWNYTKTGQRDIPEPFRATTGTFATLRDNTRNSTLNGGGNLSSGTVSTSNAMSKGTYSQFQSAVNGTPHGVVHTSVSGNMGGFNTAGLDPLFWLHHCNIDRLWEAWLAQGTGQSNPITDVSWMNATSTFADENGGLVLMANSDVLETVSQLRYQYEDPKDCVPLFITLVDLRHILLRRRIIFQLVLAEGVQFRISSERIPLTEMADMRDVEPFLERRLDRDMRAEIVLEGLRLNRPMQGYFELWGHLSLEEEGLRPTRPVLLGNISTFGMDEESMAAMRAGRAEPEEMQEAMTQRIEVTDAVRELFGAFDAEKARLGLELRAVSGVEKEEADVERLNDGVEVKVDQIRYEVYAEEG